MITNEGKNYIKRYLAGQVGTMADVIAFGLGTSAEAIDDAALDFELDRADINLVAFDFIADKLIFKATVSEEFEGTIYEIALFSRDADDQAGAYSSRALVGFESFDEAWVGGAWSPLFTRNGSESLYHNPALSTSTTSTLSDLIIDLSGYSNADQFVIAYNNSDTNCSSIVIRFKVDSSNYVSYTISNPPLGYNITTLNKGSGTTTGTMDWSNVAIVEIVTTAKSSGATRVDFDGIRIEDADTINPDYVLVSRRVLTTPYVKVAGTEEEIEFSLAVTI